MLLNELWESFLKLVRSEVGNQVVDTWLKSVVLLSFDEGEKRLFFSVPNQFAKNFIRDHYLHLFRRHFPSLLSIEEATLKLEFKVEDNLSSTSKQAVSPCANATQAGVHGSKPINNFKAGGEQEKTEKSTRTSTSIATPVRSALFATHGSKTKKSLLSGKYSFKNFVVGPHNRLACSAAQAISKGLSRRYNPLFIYGKTGLGKTHLLHCIGNEYKNNNAEGKLIYKSSAMFVDEFIQAIRQGKIQHFTDKYRKTDMLLIDDVQFFSQKEQTQEVFFHIFNQMYDEHKQIVLSCDMMPQQLSGFQERLISRFSWGLSADITTPTLETRIAILNGKAEDLKIELAPEVAHYIAENFSTNIREMEGALTRLAALTMLTFDPISIELARKELLSCNAPAIRIPKIQPDDILHLTLKKFGFTVEELRSKRRDGTVVIARQMLAYLLKKYTQCSLRTIGHYIGGRTHSTVLYAVSRAEKKIIGDGTFQEQAKELETTLS